MFNGRPRRLPLPLPFPEPYTPSPRPVPHAELSHLPPPLEHAAPPRRLPPCAPCPKPSLRDITAV
uniref:Si946076e12 n=1 Tax=Arundo donax TaxID=35708 RepID=A0A0A9FA62_ARUDO